MIFGKVECGEHMPVIFYFRTFGNVESQTGKDVNDFVAHNGKRMACAQLHGISRTGQVEIVLSVVLVVELFFQCVDFFLCFCFQLVELHADFFFLFGSHIAEICHQVIDGSFLAEVFDAQSFEFFGIGGFQGPHLFKKLINLSYHILRFIVIRFSLNCCKSNNNIAIKEDRKK